jgi:hypothetical protein
LHYVLTGPYHMPHGWKAKHKADFRHIALMVHVRGAYGGFMRPGIIPSAVLFIFWTSMSTVSDGQPTDSRAGKESSGIISGLNGQAVAMVPGSRVSRSLKIGDRVAAGEEIRVDSSGTVELLWERRALCALGGHSRIVLQEAGRGSVLVHVLDGTIRIAYSYNEGHPTDTLKIEMPETRMTMRGGIIEAAVAGAAAAEHPRRTKLAAEGTAGEIIRVIEGQAQIERHSPVAKPFLLKAGHEWRGLSREAGSEAIRPIVGQGARELAVSQDHHRIPAGQRMVQLHVEHALEVERALSHPAQERNEPEGGLKGAIVATSLGIPLTALSGAGSAITTTTGVTGPVPGAVPPAAVAPPVTVPPAVAPPIGPPAVGPIVQTPVIPTPNVTGLTPSQSGGINSSSLLRDVIQDIARGGNGNGRGRGRNRD